MSETTKLRPDLSRPFDWAQYKAGETVVCTRDGRAVGTIAQFPECRSALRAVVGTEICAFSASGRYLNELSDYDYDLFFAETPRVFTDEEVWAFANKCAGDSVYVPRDALGLKQKWLLAFAIARGALAQIERAKRGGA